MSQPINFTQSAQVELKRLYRVLKAPAGYGIRIGLKQEAGAEPVYQLGFDEPTEKDHVFPMADLTIIIAKSKSMHLAGLTVDYIADEKGFVFLHPGS